jgi:Recombination endonuclease VII
MAMQLKRDYGRIRKTPDELGRYRCSKCRNWKIPSDFNKSSNQTSGLSYACRECMKEQVRSYNIPTKYGITYNEFQQKFINQSGKCGCCNSELKMNGKGSERPCVDHNHKTKQVRDLLCGRCNLAAGNVQDSSLKAKELATYLEKWNC